MKLGFIGLGLMGAPMAANLLAAGHELRVHDLRREAAEALLVQAQEAHRDQKPVEARAFLQDLRARYPSRPADLERAAVVEKGWDEEAERALLALESGLRDLEASPSPVIREALAARAAALLVRFRGAASESRIRSVASKLQALATSGPAAASADDAAQLLSSAKSHLDRGELGHAGLCLGLARERQLDAELSRQADHLRGILAERRRQRAEREER